MQKLFRPAHIQNVRIKNRVIALPVFTGYALPDARVSPLMFEHYRRLAGSGAAVVVVPNVAVARNGRTSERSLLLDDDKYIDGLSRLSGVIRENGAIACLQLNHAGRYAVAEKPMMPSALDVNEAARNISALKNFMGNFPFVKRFGLTAHVARMTAGWRQQMTEADIDAVVAAFGEAAGRAVRAGFDMIELHGATGYLIAQFLSARTNRRSGPWGGSFEARMRFPLKIVDEIQRHLPDTVPIGFRLILDAKIEKGITAAEALHFATKLEKHGVAYLSATAGTYQSMFNPDVAKEFARPGYLASLTGRLRAHVNVPVIISGRIVSPKLAEQTLQKGEADLIGLGRPLLADPEWINKARRKGRIIGCKNCNTCFQQVSLGESVICARWPKVLQDRIRLESHFNSRPGYRILIVLASVADLQFARQHIRRRLPVHAEFLDRQLFINALGEKGFPEAARGYVKWCDRCLRTRHKRMAIENIFIAGGRDPVDVVMENLKDNFGFVSLFHDETSSWKRQLVLSMPADVVVCRHGTHPNVEKVMVPCDLSTFTLMQIRVALHVLQGLPGTELRFVHVARSPGKAAENWSLILEKFEMDPKTALKIIPAGRGLTVAQALLAEVSRGHYGSLIIGRRGGFAKVRRRILGSVSELLLKKLPRHSFAIVG